MPLGLNIVTRIHRHMKWKEDCVRMPSLLVCSTAFPFSPLTGSCAIKDRYYTPDSVLEGGLHCSSKSDRKEHQIGEPLGSMLQLEDHTHWEYNEDLIYIPSLPILINRTSSLPSSALAKPRTHR
jgi:hypothetical protein